MSRAARTAPTLDIAYNSCRNRHCPKCQGAAAQAMAGRPRGRAAAGPLLPRRLHAAGADRRHRLPEQGRDLRPAVQGRRRDAASPSPPIPSTSAPASASPPCCTPGARRSTHHPHVHCIVPGGGLSPDGERWIACRPGFFLPVRVLSRLFRRLFLEQLAAAHDAGRLALLRRSRAARRRATPSPPIWRRCARPNGSSTPSDPSAGPRRCSPISPATPTASPSPTAASIAFDDNGVTFSWKDYRAKGRERHKIMTLASDEFIRRFLHPRPAQRLPPHPPLRPVRQWRPRREPRPRPRAARRSGTARRTRRR